MADSPEIRVLCDDYCVAACGNIGILIWRKQTTRAGIEDGFRLYTELSSSHREGVGWMVIVQRTSTPPDEEIRKLLSDAMRRTTGVRAFASVNEGHGFQAAAFRAVSTGFTVSTRMPYPRKLFTSSDDAARWLVMELTQRGMTQVRTEQLLTVLGNLREQMQSGASASIRPPR